MSNVAAVIALAATMPAPATVPSIDATHAEVVDWARAVGMDQPLVDFLADRDDCAGATPDQWLMLSQVGETPAFKALSMHDDSRRLVAEGIVGCRGFYAYLMRLLRRAEAEANARDEARAQG